MISVIIIVKVTVGEFHMGQQLLQEEQIQELVSQSALLAVGGSSTCYHRRKTLMDSVSASLNVQARELDIFRVVQMHIHENQQRFLQLLGAVWA